MAGHDPQDLSIAAARQRLLDAVGPVTDTERLTLAKAHGRALAEPVIAPCALPREDHSALDGYALRGVDARAGHRLRIVGRALAGAPWSGTVTAGSCARIMTGAVLPAGADTVVAQECVQADDRWVTLDVTLEAGANVRRAGEDVVPGTAALPAGCPIDARRIALLAAFGLDSVAVMRPVRVGLLSTGSELRPPGTALGSGELYDSNRPMLAALLSRPYVRLHDLGAVPDDPEQLSACFAQTADLDLVVVSGGVSVGEADWVRPVLAQRGRLDFWRVAIKPGRPLAFGRLGAAWLMGLPGNPVSAYVTFRLFVEPVVQRLAGLLVREPLTLLTPIMEAIAHRADRTTFLRGRWTDSADGGRGVVAMPEQGSAMLGSLAQADCLIELPAGRTAFSAGTAVKVWPL